MKIVCSTCKKTLGIQKPFNDKTEVPAKCPECFQKEKAEALKPQPMPTPGKRKPIAFENGFSGYLTVAGIDTPMISLWDLMVSGKKIFCAKDRRENFEDYLEMIESERVDVTFMYSSSIPITQTDGRRKKKPPEEQEKKPETIHYNCTVTVPKDEAIKMFDNVAERLLEFVKLMADMAIEQEMADRKAGQNKSSVEK